MPTALTLPNKSNQVLQTTIRSQSILGPQVKLKGKGEISKHFENSKPSENFRKFENFKQVPEVSSPQDRVQKDLNDQ